MNDKSALFVSLEDVDGRIITEASVELTRASETVVIPLRFDLQQEMFVGEPVDAGDYVLMVDAAGYVTETVPLRLTPPRVSTSVMLGRDGEPYYVVGGRRIYYPATDTMAAMMPASAPADARARLSRAMGIPGLEAMAPADPGRPGKPGQPVIVTFSRRAMAPAREQQEGRAVTLREMPEVIDAGPVVYAQDSDVRFISRVIEVITHDGVTREQLDAALRRFGLHVVSQDRLDPRLFNVATDEMPGADYGAMPDRLAELPEIRRATSLIVTSIKTTAVPADALFPLQFHSMLTRCPEAWEKLKNPLAAESYGSADIVIAVSDDGIATMTIAGISAAIHPAFSGTVTGGTLVGPFGSNKLVDAFNFSVTPMVRGNDGGASTHGSWTSGVISAAADAHGVVGAAANTRLASYMFPLTANDQFVFSFSYYAGIDPGWAQVPPYGPAEPFPFLLGSGGRLVPGAAIINASHTGPGPMTAKMERSLQRLTLFGRERRGTLLFAAAGNEDSNLRTSGSWSETTNVLRVAASSLDVREEEVRMNYSGYSVVADQVLDFCAPSKSHNTVPAIHEPPKFYAITTAARTSTTGGTPGTLAARVNVTDAPLAGTAQLKVAAADFAGFAMGQMVIVRDKTNPLHAEIHELAAPVGPDTIVLMRNLGFDYAAAAAEIIRPSGTNAYSRQFGGTSAATPQASAIAALMLSMNPALSWLEVRQLMRDTAVPTALRYRGTRYTAPPHYRYRWLDPMGLDLIDASGLLIIDGAGPDRTIAAAMGPLGRGTRFLNLNDSSGIAPRQALVIGAETKLDGPHPMVPPNTINVDRPNSFEPGDKIFIGRDVRTVLIRAAAVGDAQVWVQSVDGIEPLDFITIGAESVRVTSVRRFAGSGLVGGIDYTGEAETGLNVMPAIAAAHARGDIVTLADTHMEGPFTVTAKAAATLTLNNPVMHPHPDDRSVWKEGTEVRAVIRTVGLSSVEIDPLHNAHPFNAAGVENVRIGRIASYGLGFGRGRLDALEAVQAAINHTHDERDLVVRNFVGDDGKTNVAIHEVESPDLWVRNDAASPAGTPYADVPHQLPEITVDPAIHIGIGLNDLEVSGACTSAAEVTLVIEIDHTGAPDTFRWSRNGAPPTAGVAITAAAQVLSDGVAIRFASSTAHVLGDRWMVRARQIVNRFAHIRIRNRGTQAFFTRSGFTPASSPNALDPARRRLMLCVSDGYPVSRFVSVAAVPGPNDLEVIAPYVPGPARSLFTIEITATAAGGDTFTWYRDGNVKPPPVVLSAGSEHVLEAGVKIRFGSHTGHAVLDRWNLYARSGADAFLNIDHYWDSDVPPAIAPFPAELFDPIAGRAGTRVLFTDAVNGLAAATDEIRNVAWPEALRPPTNNPNAARPLPLHPRRFFLLAETVPHDGKLMGFTAKTNNNISFREIAFAKVRFAQEDGTAPLESQIDVDSTGIATEKKFRVEVRTTAGTFRAEKVRLRFTGRKGAAPEEKRLFHHPGAWTFGVPPLAWATAAAPLEAIRPDGSQPAATGEQFDMSFACSVTLDRSFTEVVIEAEIVSEFRDHPVAVGKHTFSIFQSAPLPLGTGAAKAAALPKPSSFVFSDMALTQTAQQTFGPVVDPLDANASTKRYRATALFTAVADVKAYAAVNGLLVLQRDPANNDTVNLFLRPLRQPIAGFTPIKYFVYRGIRLTDWLKGTAGADAKLIRDEAGSPPFLASVWPTFKTQNPGVTDMPGTVFGYDPDTQTPADLLDDIFFRVGAATQLPLAVEGMELGSFDHTKPFGFEIVIEEGDYAPTLDYARKASYEIDIGALPNGTPAEQFARRLKQEEILNFIDPAAFYGLHMHNGGVVRAPGIPPHKGQEIYINVVSRFLTKNRLYIDIRSENGSSLAFQGNYDVGGNQLQRGLTAGALTAQAYATSGWPIVSFDNNSPLNTVNDYNEVHLQLPRNDNENPVLYAVHGELLTPAAATNGSFIRGTDLNTANPWTQTVGFRIPNTGVNPAKVAAAWILRLVYGRLDVAARVVPLPNTVLRTTTYTDNVFGPIDRAPQWKGAMGIKWLTTQDNRYVDADTERGWRQMMQCGLARQTSGTPRVLLYAIATARDVDPTAAIDFAPLRSLPAGVSDRPSFFAEAGLFGIYQLVQDQTHDGAAIVRTLQLQQAPKDGYAPDSALLLGLSQVEFDALAALGPGQSREYLRTLVLDTKTPIVDPNRPADRYLVGVQGLKTADGEYESVFPAAGSEVFVYTVDGQLFASKAFADAEPLPTAYARNYEEAMGVRDWPQRERKISSVTLAPTKTITIPNYDWTRDVIAGGKIRIDKSALPSAEFTVAGVALNGADTVITLTGGALSNAAPLGSAFTPVRKVEDRMIDLDQGAPLGGFQQTRSLVDSFVTAIAAIANDAGAKAGIQARIDDECAKILGRARARARADRAHAEDHERVLYWARQRMVVAVKSHAFCLSSIAGRDELLLRLEKKSRGYELDFAGAPGGAHKILITGFDPFQLDLDIEQSNPSAAVALALHGATIAGATKQAYVESAIFPVRYRDFDAGRVEELVAPRLRGVGKVDSIITISQNGSSEFYDLERFAGRRRGGAYDNERVIQAPHPVTDGAEFHETTLPPALVPGPFGNPPDDEQRLFYDQSYESDTKSYGKASETLGAIPGQNANTPSFTLASVTGTAQQGSGGDYLSNEIFYRVARQREQAPVSTTLTGHLHIPSPSKAKVGIADVIAEVENLIKRWLDSLP